MTLGDGFDDEVVQKLVDPVFPDILMVEGIPVVFLHEDLHQDPGDIALVFHDLFIFIPETSGPEVFRSLLPLLSGLVLKRM